MLIPFRKIVFTITFNFTLFVILIIGIQNSTNKIKVNLITTDSVRLPISFVLGLSFITGSITGSLINIKFRDN